MFRIRSSFIIFWREVSLKSLPTVKTRLLVFFRVTLMHFRDEKN